MLKPFLVFTSVSLQIFTAEATISLSGGSDNFLILSLAPLHVWGQIAYLGFGDAMTPACHIRAPLPFFGHIFLNYADAIDRDTWEKVEVGPVWAAGGIRWCRVTLGVKCPRGNGTEVGRCQLHEAAQEEFSFRSAQRHLPGPPCLCVEWRRWRSTATAAAATRECDLRPPGSTWLSTCVAPPQPQPPLPPSSGLSLLSAVCGQAMWTATLAGWQTMSTSFSESFQEDSRKRLSSN